MALISKKRLNEFNKACAGLPYVQKKAFNILGNKRFLNIVYQCPISQNSVSNLKVIGVVYYLRNFILNYNFIVMKLTKTDLQLLFVVSVYIILSLCFK